MATIDLHGNTRALVTGATGFVGSALCVRLRELGYDVRCSIRNPSSATKHATFDTIATGELGPNTDWTRALSGIDVVFHLAARTHVLRDTSLDPLAEFRRINAEGTHSLARAALRAGVRRVVFLSSIKVTGERTDRFPFTEDTPLHPEDGYGASKREAEQALHAVARDTDLETVILRPPLVYGPGVKGNLLRLTHWIAGGVPLPFASISNRRSLVYVGNLVDAIIAASKSPTAAGNAYLVSDNDDVSTPDLIQSIATALQMRPRLFPCPPALLMAGATILGKREEMRRLTGSLQIDSSKIRNDLPWNPRFQMTQGLALTAQWYYSQYPTKSNT